MLSPTELANATQTLNAASAGGLQRRSCRTDSICFMYSCRFTQTNTNTLRTGRVLRDGRMCGVACCQSTMWWSVGRWQRVRVVFARVPRYAMDECRCCCCCCIAMRSTVSAFTHSAKWLRRTHVAQTSGFVLYLLFSNSCESVVCKLIENDIFGEEKPEIEHKFDIAAETKSCTRQTIRRRMATVRWGWCACANSPHAFVVICSHARCSMVRQTATHQQRNGSSSSHANAVKLYEK